MFQRCVLLLSILGLLVSFAPAQAGHQTLLGSRFLVKDAQPVVDPTKRQWLVQAKESASAASIAGDPTASGATVTVFTEGATSGSQVYTLPQGTSASGKPFWKATASGFVYSDPDGVNGPLKGLKISRSASGVFQLKAKASGKLGTIEVLPPNSGQRACVRVDLGGGDSYHVLFGDDATIDKNDEKQFQSSAPTSAGLCCDLESSPPCCPASCPADACRLEGSCDPIDGVCDHPSRPDGTTCDAGLDNGVPLTCSAGTCDTCIPAGVCTCTLDAECPSGETCTDGFCSSTQRACAFGRQCPSGNCSITSSPTPRYVDNGDGTITDRQTCLVWEKKDSRDGTPAVCPGSASCSNPHDADNLYTWGGGLRDGSAFTSFLAGLNAESFAGRSDWRVPDIELPDLVDPAATGCGSGQPCIDPAFETNCTPTCSGTDLSCSCTVPFGYWVYTSPNVVDFLTGSVVAADRTSGQAVRAVRGCTATVGYGATTSKALCFNQCAINCSNDGNCIYGCMIGQDFSADICYSSCSGFAPTCLDSCLQTVDCIAELTWREGSCTPP